MKNRKIKISVSIKIEEEIKGTYVSTNETLVEAVRQITKSTTMKDAKNELSAMLADARGESISVIQSAIESDSEQEAAEKEKGTEKSE